MNTKKLKKDLIKYIIPSMLAMMLSGFYSIIDGLFIGNFTGNDALGAINMVWPLQCILSSMAIGLGIGSAVLMSMYNGEGREKEADNVWGMGVLMLVSIGIIVPIIMLSFLSPLLDFLGADGHLNALCRQYIVIILSGGIFISLSNGLNPLIRNRGNTIGATAIMSSGLVTNIVLDYFLVYKYPMGLFGAGLATMIAQAVVACLSVIYLFKSNRHLFSKSNFILRKSEVKKICKIGISPFGQNLVPSLTILFTNWKCIQYGGNAAVNIFSVVIYILTAIQLLLQGIGDGVQPLFSFYYGAKKEKELHWIYRHAFALSIIVSVTSTFLTVRFAGALSDTFGIVPEIRDMCITAITIVAFSYTTLGISRLTCSFFYATGKSLVSTILVYIEPCLLLPVLLSIMGALKGINGVWMTSPLVQFVLCMAALTMKLILDKRKDQYHTI